VPSVADLTLFKADSWH